MHMQLSDPVNLHFRLDEKHVVGLKRLKLETIRDILWYFPARYSNIGEIKKIENITEGEQVVLYGKILNPKTKKSFRTRIPMGEATLDDGTGKIKIIWFHQAFMAKKALNGDTVKISGKVSENKNGLYISNPELEQTPFIPIDTHDSLFEGTSGEALTHYPIYPETRSVTSKWLYHAVQKIMKSGVLDTITEYIPETIIKKYNLPTLRTALIWIHAPQKKGDADAARKRFAFEEVFFIQLARQIERKEYESLFSYKLAVPKKDIADFISRFPFTPTAGQNKVIDQILGDLVKDKPMSRLVEGDVGSGKTFIAATVAYAVIKNRPIGQNFGNIQVAYMAPTEILATQLFENFINYFAHTGISIGLITGSGCRKFPSKVASATNSWTTISRTQLLKWVKNGEIPILIGTHALIQKSVDFEDLGLVIIDEQHRFGTNQRMKLAKKEGHSPHFLSMTATPIPRTLTMTIYGDLDLSVLDEMPKGRKQVITEIVTPDKRNNAYEKIKKELAEGRQLYVICPRINEPDPDQEMALNVKSVTAEAKRLKNEIFPEYEIGILHSKMTKQRKEEMMIDFSEKKIDILVATSVIEVGVNVPNATVIIIEGAERFGLAQLHQLRGRVIRSNHQAYCYLLADAKTQKTLDRLKALVTAKNGFELAELDLALRGAGELAGTKQWGLSDLGMEAIKNIKMVEAARTEAIGLVDRDPTLKAEPKLKQALTDQKLEEMHFE